MMKYWTRLSFFGVFLMTALLLTACGGDDDDDFFDDDRTGASAVIGEWAYFEYGSNGRWMFMEYVNFKRNGSFTSVSYYVEGRNLDSDNARITNIEREKRSGSYSASNGVMTLTADGDTWQVEYSVRSDRLIIYTDDGDMDYELLTDETEAYFNQMDQWYRQINNEASFDDDDEPVGEGGGNTQVDGNLLGEWVAMEANSNGRYIYMEKVNLKSDGTYVLTCYAINGRNLNTSNGTIEMVDRLESRGKYRASNGILKLTNADGETGSIPYRVDETSFTLAKDGESVTYQRMDDSMRQFVDKCDQIYQALN